MSAENVLDLSHAAKWTNAAGKIQLVKCIKPDGTTGGGVRPLVTWPAVGGEVTPSDPRRDGECGGGIHGWPWGLFLGDGARPDYSTDWLVIECDPQDIYCIGGKCKCVGPCTVVYRGQWWGAMEYTQHERTQLIQHVAASASASASASATGYGGAALATGRRGAASATGGRGAASATGDRGAASATGYGGAALATSYGGAALATGYRGAASATGGIGAALATSYRGAASATGDRGAASATGDGGAALATSDWGAASATGYGGAALATGDWGAASATGPGGAALATGRRGAASATGDGGAALATSYGGAALATGYMGAALATGEESTVGSAASGTCVLMARSGYWIVRRGAVLLQSWQDGDAHPYRVFDSIALGLEDGEKVAIVAGELRRATAAPDRSQP